MKIEKKIPQHGDTKVKTKFLIFPMYIMSNTKKTIYWLCRVKVTYKYVKDHLMYEDGRFYKYTGWLIIDLTDKIDS